MVRLCGVTTSGKRRHAKGECRRRRSIVDSSLSARKDRGYAVAKGGTPSHREENLVVLKTSEMEGGKKKGLHASLNEKMRCPPLGEKKGIKKEN